MIITTEINLCNFEGWGGGEDTLSTLSHEQIFKLESVLEEEYPNGIDEQNLNDILRDEQDWIASLLDYPDWETLKNHQEYGDTVKVKIYDIKWDIDEDGDTILPNEIVNEFDYKGDNDELEEEISDWLSDECGYCHEGYDYEIIEEDK